MYVSSSVLAGVWVFIGILALAGICAFVGQILLGVAVHHNAKAHCNSSPGMWCALTILFGWIPAVIYLATRSSAQNRIIICPQCKAPHPVGLANCPQCGVHNMYSEPFHNEHTELERSRSKKFLIASIVLYGVGVLAGIAAVVVFVTMVFPYGDIDDLLEYHRYGHRGYYW